MLYLKRNWLLLILVIFSAACKKDKNKTEDHGIAISKIFENGALLTEFEFDANHKIVRETWYESDGSFDFRIQYTYDPSGYLLISAGVDQQGKAYEQTFFSRNASHQVLKHELKSLSGNDSGKIVVRVKYDYGLDGFLKSQTWVELDSDKPYTSREFSRHADGSLKSVNIYNYNPAKIKQRQTIYALAEDSLSRTLINFNVTPYDARIAEMESNNSKFQSFTGGVMVNKEVTLIASNRVYNPDGYLISQTITSKQTIPAEMIEASKMEYQYIKW
jgi:hypothetical protein